jgi:site-specific recombinase XerD
MTPDDTLDYWAAYMRAQHCTERTIRERMIFMRSVLRHTEAENFDQITKPQLIAFLGKKDQHGRPLTGRTKQNYRSALHTFFTWLQDEGLRLDNPAARLPRPRVEYREANPVTTEEIQTVLTSGIRGRTVMMVLLASYQGLRASEIAAVHGSDVDLKHGTITIRDGKGRTTITRPLHPLVRELAVAEHYPADHWWFPGLIGGEHVRGKSVSNTLNTAFRRAGIIGHRAHDMRKWMATTLLENGADSVDVQHALRHRDLQTIHIYMRPHQERLRGVVETLPAMHVPTSPEAAARRRTGPPNRVT